MSFTEKLRRQARQIWEAQIEHPFVISLGKGTLPQRKFRFYILQDARFLEELAKVFALGVHRAPDPDTALSFAKLVDETIRVERGLHEQYGKRWKLSRTAMQRTPMAPTTYAYTRHMLTVAQQGTLGELTAVTLPCAWIYCLIGQHLLRNGPPDPKHPYREWLQLYGAPEFARVTHWMRTLVDREAKTASQREKTRMADAFLTSSRYEWMFWDMAWREEHWPI
ncbi:MAG: thiaminase II [Nitrospirae bacterium]|nr:MAG: thiaminase II [Nitrospirota bacterium]